MARDEELEEPSFCAVPDCLRAVPPNKVMCQQDWDLVPRPMRIALGEAILAAGNAEATEDERRAAKEQVPELSQRACLAAQVRRRSPRRT